MKNSALMVLAALVLLLPTSCTEKRTEKSNNVTVVSHVPNAAEGLDLKYVGELVQKVKTPEELEQKLNATGSINNLDLDNNGKVDYINVQGYPKAGTPEATQNPNARGFALSVNLGENEVQEIANILVEKNADNTASVQLTGNEQIYGSNHHYHSSFSLGDALLLSYLFRPGYTPYYHRPYYYGHYPGYYSPYRSVPVSTYRATTSRQYTSTTYKKTTTPVTKSKITSPTKGKSSNNVRASLSKPTASQKKLQPKSNKKVNSSGFNKSKSTGASKTKSSSNGASTKTTKPKSKPRSKSSTRRSSPSRSRSSGGRRSDMTWKTDINEIQQPLVLINSLNGYYYNWDVENNPSESFTHDPQIGVMAQEVQEVLPAAVYVREDGKLLVDYNMMVPVLIEAVQELHKENLELRALIEESTSTASK